MTDGGEEGGRGVSAALRPDQPPPPPSYQYGTFQGVANYYVPNQSNPPPPPVIGFPQPVPPAAADPSAPPPPFYYPHGYHTVPGYYAIAEGRPVRERRLPCCGLGVGWFLFIIGFFLGSIPWYIGVLILLCGRIDNREKPGYIACTIAAILVTVVVLLGVTRDEDDWLRGT